MIDSERPVAALAGGVAAGIGITVPGILAVVGGVAIVLAAVAGAMIGDLLFYA